MLADMIRRSENHAINSSHLLRLYDACLRAEDGIRYRRSSLLITNSKKLQSDKLRSRTRFNQLLKQVPVPVLRQRLRNILRE